MRSGAGAARLRSSDPWIDVDSLYSGVVDIDSMPVMVDAKPGGRRLNVNSMSEEQLRTFYSHLLSDFTAADELAQSIMDWRDADDLKRTRGAERDLYLKDNAMVLPANAQFREVDDLLDVRGMTPEILEKARPYLRTYGGGPVNLNTAEEPVLRAIPGMTDAVLTRILALRANGGRIRTMNEVTPGGTQVQPGRQPTAQQTLASRIGANSVVETVEVDLIITAQAGTQAQPARLSATISRQTNGTQTSITWRQW
jgi:general secretion pathway protein K